MKIRWRFPSHMSLNDCHIQMTHDLWKSLLGGMLIGAGSATLILLNGKIAGISGIFGRSIEGAFGPQAWRLAFLLGLVIPAVIFGIGAIRFDQTLPLLAFSGLLVGLGTRLGSGCTSGHGVCGIASLSLRSLLATLTFIFVAGITVFIARHGVPHWHF
jgi:uncharacterized protein